MQPPLFYYFFDESPELITVVTFVARIYAQTDVATNCDEPIRC